MKTYNVKDYEIRVYEAPKYSFDSTDNLSYDQIIDIGDERSTFIGMEIERDMQIRTALIITPYLTPLHSFIAPHQDGLFMMLDHVLCFLT